MRRGCQKQVEVDNIPRLDNDSINATTATNRLKAVTLGCLCKHVLRCVCYPRNLTRPVQQVDSILWLPSPVTPLSKQTSTHSSVILTIISCLWWNFSLKLEHAQWEQPLSLQVPTWSSGISLVSGSSPWLPFKWVWGTVQMLSVHLETESRL